MLSYASSFDVGRFLIPINRNGLRFKKTHLKRTEVGLGVEIDANIDERKRSIVSGITS